MSYPAAQVANKFLQIASSQGMSITPMQLQKLVYIAHGWHLGSAGQPLIAEDVQAWRFGPVIYDLYSKTRNYGNQPITEWLPTGTLPWQRDVELDPDTSRFVEEVWGIYSGYSAIELSNMTHLPGTPWYKRWVEQGGSGEYFAVIDDASIAEFYRNAFQEKRIPASA